MYEQETNLSVLARRAGLGDHAAEAQLRRGLEQQLPRLVRHALRHPTRNVPLAGQLGLERARFAAEEVAEAEAHQLVEAAARRVCDQVMQRVTLPQRSPVARETVRN